MKIIVTITPPTPNGDLHLGHLSGPFLSADVFARRMKQLGHDAIVVSYTDDYQSYLPRKTTPLLRKPFEYARLVREMMLQSMASAEIYLDYFMPSSRCDNFAQSAEHYYQLVQHQVHVQERKSFYCSSCDVYGYEGFGRTNCNWCGTSSDANQCEHCARMPDIDKIEHMTCMSCHQEMSEVTVPQHVWEIGQNYTDVAKEHKGISKRACLENYLEEALDNVQESWGITRPGDAGLELTCLDSKPLHTWFMGLAGYRSAVKTLLEQDPERGEFTQWWHPDTQLVHFLGYDCSYSHAVGYVSQQLHDKEGPGIGHFITNRFLKLDGDDFSTSRGHAIWIKDITSQYPADAVRLYTALNAPETEVANFSVKDFEHWYQTFFLSLVRSIRADWSVERADFVGYEPVFSQWEKNASLEEFSIAGMAKQLIAFSEALLITANPTREHWLKWAEMAAALCPVLSNEVQSRDKQNESTDLSS